MPRLTGRKRSRSTKMNRANARTKLARYGARTRTLAVRGYAPQSNRGGELKVYDTGDYLTHTAPPSGEAGDLAVWNLTITGLVTPMFIPLQGADFNQRIGRKCNIKSIYAKWRCFPRYIVNPSGAPYTVTSQWPETAVRLLIVHDTNPNGVVPLLSDILQPTETLQPDPLSFINMNNRDRFRIILDKFHQFGALSTGGGEGVAVQNALGSTTWNGKKYKKVDIPVVFNSTSTGGIADIASGVLYACVLGTESLGSNRYSSLEMNWRIRYSDS